MTCNDILIIGGGPAGISAALQARRDGWNPLLVSDEALGGMVRGAHRLDNLPGFPAGISGASYAQLLETQLRNQSLAVLQGRVTALEKNDREFLVTLDQGDEGILQRQARTVIVATGTQPRPWKGLEGLPKALSFALHRDARSLPERLTDQHLVVLGGGEAALDAALVARDRGAEVQVFVRGAVVKAPPRLQQEVEQAGIGLHCGVGGFTIRPTERGRDGIRWLDAGAQQRQGELDHLLVCIGRQARTELLTGLGLVELPPDIQSPIPGLFVAGDLIRKIDRFVATALGDGQRAARLAGQFLTAGDINT